MKTNIIIEKDGDGYLARVEGHQNLFAFAYSEKEAIIELKNVVEMIMDYHLEQVNDERLIRNELATAVEKYAVQV
jgi:predicted RNase H-like HicB family nuclease